MIICILNGGFGNHLLCVSLGIILANKHNTKIHLFGNGNGINKFSKDTRNTIFKIINKDIIDNKYNDKKCIIINNKIDYYNILNNYNSNYNYVIKCIHIDDISIYKEYINVINNNILINNAFNYDFENTITISLRLGKIGEACYPSPFQDEKSHRLPFKYFKDGIEKIMEKNKNINTLLICCDNFEDEFVKKFEIFNNLDIILNKKNTYQQFCDIINSKYFITSLSTFSLWGVILNKNNCYCPFFKMSGCILIHNEDEFYKNISPTLYNMDNVTKISI